MVGWRKFTFIMLCLLIGCIFSYIGKLDMVTKDMLIYLAGVYVAGNAASKLGNWRPIDKYSFKNKGDNN